VSPDANPEKFEELALPLFDSLYNFARWLSHNGDEAEDLVQETYAKALRGFAGFTPGTDFRAWMFRILKNAFLNSRTALRSRMTVALEDQEYVEPATLQTPESLALAASDRDTVQRAIEALPAIFREVILLCDVEEMKYQEIADVLGVPIGTVMSRISRARRALRAHLLEQGASRVHSVDHAS
jgi:RNA polymerase sigma-70 factor (ECF subfamily)